MPVSFTLVDPTAKASQVFVEEQAIRNSLGGLLIPQRILVFGQYNAGKTPTDNVPQLILSRDDGANRYGYGSLLDLQLQAVFKGAGSVPVYACPLSDAGGSAAAVGTINVDGNATSAGTIALYIAGKRVAIAVANGALVATIEAAIIAAINADPTLPVTAAADSGDILLTAKWAGLSGNQITIEQDLAASDASAEPTGATLTIAPMALGSGDPLMATALGALGDDWYTWIVSPYNADASLDELETAGAARSHPAVKRLFLAVAGYTDTRANLLTALSSRNSNSSCLMPVDGSPNHPAEIAAATVGVCAARAQVTPGRPYRGLVLPDIWPGTARWTYSERDAVVKAGGSTYRVTPSDTVAVEDLCTTRTLNDLAAADYDWLFAETVANVQAKVYSLEQVFLSEPFVAGVIVDDASTTSANYAIRPKTVKAYLVQLIDELWVPYALTKARDAVVAGIVTEIDGGNPNRINAMVPDVLAAGLKIIAVLDRFSFYAPVGAAS